MDIVSKNLRNIDGYINLGLDSFKVINDIKIFNLTFFQDVGSAQVQAPNEEVQIFPTIDTNPEQRVDKKDGSLHAGKDIIIGLAQDTDPKNLVVFCASLRK